MKIYALKSFETVVAATIVASIALVVVAWLSISNAVYDAQHLLALNNALQREAVLTESGVLDPDGRRVMLHGYLVSASNAHRRHQPRRRSDS